MKCNGGKISEAPSALRSARSLLSARSRSGRPNKREKGRNRARKSRRRMRRDKTQEAATVRAIRPISIHFSRTVLLCKYSAASGSGHRKARLLRTTRLTFGGFGRRERERKRARRRKSGSTSKLFRFHLQKAVSNCKRGPFPAKVGRGARRLASKHP